MMLLEQRDFRSAVRRMSESHVSSVADIHDRSRVILAGVMDTFTNMGSMQRPVLSVYGGRAGDIMSAVIPPEKVGSVVVESSSDRWTVERVDGSTSARGVAHCEIRLDGVRVAAGRLVADGGEGFAPAADAVRRNRTVAAAASAGRVKAAMSSKDGWVPRRRQCGQSITVPQGIRREPATIARSAEAARGFVHAGAKGSDSEAAPGESSQMVSIALLVGSETAADVAREAAQMLGSDGCTADHLIGRRVRDANREDSGEGTSEIQRDGLAKRVLA